MIRQQASVIVAVALWAGGCADWGGVGSMPKYCTDDAGAITPLDDGNPCTADECVKGIGSVHVAVPDDIQKACMIGPNAGTCIDGACVLDCMSAGGSCACASNAECPMSGPCTQWACMNEKCTRKDQPDGTLVDTPAAGDCKKSVCKSGNPQTVTDDSDKPADVPGDCNTYACNNGTPIKVMNNADTPSSTECVVGSCVNGMASMSNKSTGALCANGVCNSAGECADCLSAVDWGACGGAACPVKMCNGELCAADNSKCKSGFCADSVCCNEACSVACKSCNLAGSKGVCNNIPYYQEDPFYGAAMSCNVAVQGSVCDGNGICLRIVGIACNQDTQCLSNKCSNIKCLGATGEKCSVNADCGSNMCMAGACN